jgi:phage shock protein PspC (stress-responsive transcriptional regulator)
MTSELPPTGGSQPPPEPSSGGPSGPAHADPIHADPVHAGAGHSEPIHSGPAHSGPAAAGGPAPQSPSGPPTWSQHGTTGHGTTGHGADEFFDRIRSTNLTRPDDGRWFAGVAVGLARRWDIDPILVRGMFIALTVFGGIGVVFYGLAWLLVPQDDGRIHLQEAIRGHITAGFIGALLLSLASIGGSGSGQWGDGFWFNWGFPGGLILTAAVVFGIWWAAKQDSDGNRMSFRSPGGPSTPGPTGAPTPTGATAGSTIPGGPTPVYGNPSTGAGYVPSTPSPGQAASEAARQARATAKAQASAEAQERTRVAKARRARTGPSKMIVRLTLGIALLTAAAILAIGNANDWSESVGLIATASALAIVAAGVIVSGLSGRRAAGLAGIGFLLAIATLIGAAVHDAGVRSGQHVTIIGSQTWEPHNRDAAGKQFNLGVGEATLWLTDPAILRTTTTTDPLYVAARVGAGHLTVVVPDGVATKFDLDIGAGDVSYPNGTTYSFDGRNNDVHQELTTGQGAPRLIVNIRQGAGQLDLRTTSGTSITTIPNPKVTDSATPTPTPIATATN